MTDINRRTLLQLLASAPLAAGFVWTDTEVAAASSDALAALQTAQRTGTAFKPKFFTPHEYQTVRVLVDLIIPKDEKSGSATDAGVPEFMDFILIDQPNRQTPMRGGLAWLDLECHRRFNKTFLTSTAAERTAVLDDISWPRKAPASVSHGVPFFSSFRDLTASGFFSSKIGIEDLEYMGNTFAPNWNGCPPEMLKKLEVAD